MKSYASNPGMLKFSKKKFKEVALLLDPTKAKFFLKKKSWIKKQIATGDIQPAMVISIDPLVISCYSDELDAVILLEFPKELAVKYQFKLNERLVTCNWYMVKNMFAYSDDLIIGPNCSGNWRDVYPLLGLFVCKDENAYYENTNLFKDEDYEYLMKLTTSYLEKKPNSYRDGFFFLYNDL